MVAGRVPKQDNPMNPIKTKYEDRKKQIFAQYGVFFASTLHSFFENRKQGVAYVSGAGGMMVPEMHIEAVTAALDKVRAEYIKADTARNTKESIILRELRTHDCYASGNIEGCAVELADYGYTQDDILQVFHHHAPAAQTDKQLAAGSVHQA